MNLRDSAKIVLIGGTFTADDGVKLDTRQAIAGDSSSQMMRRTLATSWLWWSTTATVVVPILRSAGPDAYALIIGERSIVDLLPDGSTKRTALRSLLPGGAGMLRVRRALPGHSELPSDFVEVQESRGVLGEVDSSIGIRIDGPPSALWRFLDGNEYYLDKTGGAVDPHVIIDTSESLVGNEFTYPDLALENGHRVGEIIGRRFLRPNTTLVLPHTSAHQVAVATYARWEGDGRPMAPLDLTGERPLWNSSMSPHPLRYARAIPIAAQFQITGLLAASTWVPHGEMEAARELLAARYDLKLDIWDLVDNPVLRRTLLTTRTEPQMPSVTIDVPAAVQRRAQARVKQTMTERQNEAAALQAIKSTAHGLFLMGWRDEGRQESLTYGLTEPLPRYDGMGVYYLTCLTLTVLKRQFKVHVSISEYNTVDLSSYILRWRDQLVAVARGQLLDLGREPSLIWHESGGWGDDVDWRERFARVEDATPRWAAIFFDLANECRRAHACKPWVDY